MEHDDVFGELNPVAECTSEYIRRASVRGSSAVNFVLEMGFLQVMVA